MLDALVNLAQDEEFSKLLPPTGFYNYSQPIRWVVQIGQDSARLEEANLEGPLWARPYTGRTGNVDPHPLADEASYALGVAVDEKGKRDERAADKHAAFVTLLQKVQEAPQISSDLSAAIKHVVEALQAGWVKNDPRYAQVYAKDWVAFELLDGPLAGKRLFTLPDARAFWVAEAQERIAIRDSEGAVVTGECAISGENKPLIGRIPVGVKLISKPGPLHSLNKSAFVSGRTGIDGHNNLSYESADTASRVFNALSSSRDHRRIIVMDKSAGGKVKLDSLLNHVALFWVEKGKVQDVQADFDIFSAFGDAMRPVALADEAEDEDAEQPKPKAKKGKKEKTDQPKPEAQLSQLSRLLNVRWEASPHMTNLDEGKFALAVFSPNVGRTALREWFYLDLKDMLPNLRNYLNATTINDSWGKTGEPQHINALMEAVDSKDANLTRDLIRTAYKGTRPPRELLTLAVQRYRTLTIKGKQDKQLDEWQRQRHLHSLVSALKLALFHAEINRKGEEHFMTGLEAQKLQNDTAYLCGRLLAVLEEAQQVYTYRQYKKRLKTTGVQRSFGAVSATPGSILPNLLKLATKAYMPKAGKFLNTELETLVQHIVAQGGYPHALNMEGQGKLGLGYWHQRGAIRANWTPEEQQADILAEDHSETEGDSL